MAVLKQRIVTGVVGVPLVIVAIWLGGPWFSFLIAGAALAGTYEFYRLYGFTRKEPLLYVGLAWALALVLSPHYRHRSPDVLSLVITATIWISLIWLLGRPSKEQAFRSWAWVVSGVFYVGWMLSYWLNLRGLEDGRNWVYLAMLATFANDTGAFFIGRGWGRHDLAPAISPSKTWEGMIGGLTCAIAGAVVVATVLNVISPFGFKYWQIIALGFLVGLFAQLGDLVESLLKRNMEVKESGDLLPGHGGVLDRFDSLIFVGAVVYYYVIWVA
jgi:phosphatidate cytidylyltransferase